MRKDIILELNGKIVKKIPFFKNIHDETFLSYLIKMMTTVYCVPDDVIFEKGSLGQSMYFVTRGKVAPYGVKEDKTHQLYTILQEGEFFGEVALLMKIKRTASVKALSYSSLFKLDADHLLAIGEDYPKMEAQLRLHIYNSVKGRLEGSIQIPKERLEMLANRMKVLEDIVKNNEFMEKLISKAQTVHNKGVLLAHTDEFGMNLFARSVADMHFHEQTSFSLHPHMLSPDVEGVESALKEELFEEISYFMFVSTSVINEYSGGLKELIVYAKSKRVPVVAVHCSGVFPPEELEDILDDVHKIDATKLWAAMTNLHDNMAKTGNDILTYVEPMAAQNARIASEKRASGALAGRRVRRAHAASVGMLRNKLESENSMDKITNVSINVQNARKRLKKGNSMNRVGMAMKALGGVGGQRPRMRRGVSEGRD